MPVTVSADEALDGARILRRMERDLRETPLYQEIEAAYRRLAEPGFGQITAASDVRASPDGRNVAFRGARLDALEGQPSGRICLAAADGSGMRQVTHGPNEDSGPRWSPDGATLSFLSDRREAGNAQLYALETGVLGEARRWPRRPGSSSTTSGRPTARASCCSSPGHGAEQTDALGSGTLGPKAELPDWMPLVESSEDAGERRRALYVLDVASGELTQASPDELNVWEATWCGDRAVVAIVSEGAGEGAWYDAELALIDPAARTARTLRRTDVQLGWACGSPRRDARRRDRGGLQRPHDRRRRAAADRPGVGRGPQRRHARRRRHLERVARRRAPARARRARPRARGARGRRGRRRRRREIWVGSGACGGGIYPMGSPVGSGRAFAAVVEAWDSAQSVVVVDGDSSRDRSPISRTPARRRGAS